MLCATLNFVNFDRWCLLLRHSTKGHGRPFLEESMMEKGSFHTSPNWVEVQDERVKKIPLPNQLPAGIDFNELSPAVLKSSTLETLIHQNEDLMARLTITLRKNNDLEDKVAELETENKSLRARFETVKEQFMVLQEKDRSSISRAMQLAEENQTFKKQVDKLEKLYSDIYTQAQAFQKRLVQLERYRARVRKASVIIKDKAKGFDTIAQELTSARGELGSIREVMNSQQTQIVTNYEAKLADIRSEIETLRGKVGDRDELFEEKLKLQNQLVYDQRVHEMRILEFQTTIDGLEQENSAVRVELKEAILDRENQRKELEKLRRENGNMTNERQNMLEQVESLQALWNHKHKELEQAEERNRSLQKLNQNISITINQQRKEIHTLQTELDKERFTSEEKIKTLMTEIQMLRGQLANT